MIHRRLSTSTSPGREEIQSSKDTDAVDGSKTVRDKRFFYLFRNFLTVATTITNYSFTTTTYTATVLLANPAQMTCMPIGFALC